MENIEDKILVKIGIYAIVIYGSFFVLNDLFGWDAWPFPTEQEKIDSAYSQLETRTLYDLSYELEEKKTRDLPGLHEDVKPNEIKFDPLRRVDRASRQEYLSMDDALKLYPRLNRPNDQRALNPKRVAQGAYHYLMDNINSSDTTSLRQAEEAVEALATSTLQVVSERGISLENLRLR